MSYQRVGLSNGEKCLRHNHGMPRFLHFLDRVIDSGIVALLIFPPLAFGAVEVWARSTGQILILTIVTAWVVKLIWSPPRVSIQSRPGMILGGRVQLSGLEWPALVFAAVVFLQIVPLPPSLVKAVSPKTAELFAVSLPGYGDPDDRSFVGLPQWLQEEAQPEAGGVPVFSKDSGAATAAMPADWFDVGYSAWRPISLTPAHTRRALGVFLAHLAFFVVVFNQIERKAGLKRYLVILAGLVGVLSIIGIFQSLTADNKLYWWRGGGPTLSFGPFVNANNFAGWMEMALPIAAGLTFMLWRKQVRRGARAPAGVLLFGFLTILGLTAFALAQSRGGFLALLGSLAIVLIVLAVTRRLRPRSVALMLVPVMLAFAMAAWIDWPSLRDRYGTLADISKESSFQTRLMFSRVTLEMAADFPILGTGLGTFREAYYLYTPGTSDRELVHAHNDYAQVASECGVAGVVAMLWALGLLLSRGVVGGLLRRDEPSKWFVWPAAVGVLALLLHSFVSFNLQIYSNSLLFVFLCTVLMRCRADAAVGAAKRNA